MSTSKKSSSAQDGNMSLSGHLKEMRNRIAVILVFLLITFFIGFHFSSQIVTLLTDMGKDYGYEFVTLEPAELLLQYFSVAILSAIVLTFPVILYQVYAFVAPGLKKNENQIFLLVITFGLLFFIIGVLFAYKIMLPFMLKFLKDVSLGTTIKSTMSISKYVSFLLTIFIIFGIVFEMPVITVALTQLGFLKVSWLKAGRKLVIIIIFVLAAIITPPDIVSQVMTAVPMLALYELSILICTVLSKKRANAASDESTDNDSNDHTNDSQS